MGIYSHKILVCLPHTFTKSNPVLGLKLIDCRVILYLIIIAICVGTGSLVQMKSIFPGIQKRINNSNICTKPQQHILLPALFGSRHLEPLPGNIGYLLDRTLSVFIGIYIAMNIIFSSVSFRSFSPNTTIPFLHPLNSNSANMLGIVRALMNRD